MMKKILLITVLIAFAIGASGQMSPYVELLGVVNNTKFKSASIRSSALSRPVPVHLSTDGINQVVSPRFVIAKVDLVSVTWASASGWTTSANSSSVSTTASPATGCNAYFELGTSVGSWRLPTQRELMIIFLCRNEFSGLLTGFTAFVADSYWSSTSNSSSEAWAMNLSTGVMYNRAKTSAYRARCVRDL